MSPSFDLLVIGDANPDVVIHGAPAALAYGQAEQLAEGCALTVGGSAGIMACAAARLGLRTANMWTLGRAISDGRHTNGTRTCSYGKE